MNNLDTFPVSADNNSGLNISASPETHSVPGASSATPTNIAPGTGHRRVGKIARLPRTLRDLVCRMMRDGDPYSQIIAFLHNNSVPDISDQNLTNWHQGGYQDWIRDLERIDDLQAKRDLAADIIKAGSAPDIHEATLALAASQLFEVITDFDLTDLKSLLKAQPENYAKVVNSLAKISKGGLDAAKFRDHLAERKAALTKAIDQARAGLTPETISRIEAELKLL